MVSGGKLPPNSMAFVDVTDVAKAHIVACETVTAGGNRYLTAAPALLWADVAATMKKACPENPNLNTAQEEKDPKKKWSLDTSRIAALGPGMDFIPAEAALMSQIASIIAAWPEAANGVEAAPPPEPEPELAPTEESKDDEVAENPLQEGANPAAEPVAELVAAVAEPAPAPAATS